jgi:hypothetical protein
MPRLYRWSMLIIWMRQFGLSVVVGSLIVIPSISQDWKTTAVRPAECCPDFHLFHSIFSSLLQMLLPLRPRSEILLFPTILHGCLLGQSGLDRLEDLDLDTGLGLVLLGSVGSDDTLGIGETGSDGLFSIVFVVVQTRGFGIDEGL